MVQKMSTAKLQRPLGWGKTSRSQRHLCVEVKALFKTSHKIGILGGYMPSGFFVLFNTPPQKKNNACSPEKIMVLSF